MTNESRGILVFDNSGHSIFSATHEKMYDYLPISKSAAVNATMIGANAIFIHFSRQVRYTYDVQMNMDLTVM